MNLKEMRRDCTGVCVTATHKCKHYYNCVMTCCEAIKIKIDDAPKLWSNDDIRNIEKAILEER